VPDVAARPSQHRPPSGRGSDLAHLPAHHSHPGHRTAPDAECLRCRLGILLCVEEHQRRSLGVLKWSQPVSGVESGRLAYTGHDLLSQILEPDLLIRLSAGIDLDQDCVHRMPPLQVS
jgi:hypothetical protein